MPRGAARPKFARRSASSPASIIRTSPRTRTGRGEVQGDQRGLRGAERPGEAQAVRQLGANWKSGAEFRPPPGWESFAGGRGFRGQGGAAGIRIPFRRHRVQRFLRATFRLWGGARQLQRRCADDDGSPSAGRRRATPWFAGRGSWPTRPATSQRDLAWCTLRGSDARPRASVCGGAARFADGHLPGEDSRRRDRRAAPASAGRGEAGTAAAAAGDLYLRVRLAKHPDFEVRGPQPGLRDRSRAVGSRARGRRFPCRRSRAGEHQDSARHAERPEAARAPERPAATRRRQRRPAGGRARRGPGDRSPKPSASCGSNSRANRSSIRGRDWSPALPPFY